jgi:hypothetical protein
MALLHEAKATLKCNGADGVGGVVLSPAFPLRPLTYFLAHLFGKDIGTLVDVKIEWPNRRYQKLLRD